MSFVSYIYGGLSATTISGVTFYGNGSNLTGISGQDTTITGGTYSNGTATFTNNTGGTFNVTGFYTGATDVFVTGGTYSLGTATFTNNTGGTFSVSGFSQGSGSFTGGTVTGQTNFTGGLTANTISATTISGGTFYGNGLPITRVDNIITVGLSGLNTDYSTIKDAVNSITTSSSANTYTVKVAGGVYYEDPFTIPSWVSVVGDSSVSTIIEANDSSQTLIRLSDQSALFDCQVQGCTDTNVSAILYSSSTTPQSSAISYVENVRFGSNYTNAKVVASGGANIIMQCSNVKYGGYPFTVGFYATNDGSGVGRMQLRNVTSTNGGVVSTTGLIFAKADAASCGFIVNGCLLTKATAGGAAGTGFYVENGGFLRLTSVNFQRWSVGIDAPQIGSAPSIDAIALNFENNTIDVNIAHSGATGKIQGTDNFLKTIINPNSPLYEVNQDPKEITVAKKGGDFTSIKSAVDYLISSGNTSSTNRYVISVGPGVFTENEIDLTQTPYVSIVGSNIQTTQILPNTNTQHIIKIGINNEISFLSFSGAPSGYAAIYCYDIGDFAQAHKLSFYDCDTNVWVESDTQDTKFYGEYVDFNGEYEYGVKVIANNGYLALANMENYYNFPSGSNVTTCNYASGSGATLSVFVGDNQSNGVSGSTAYLARDGAGLYCSTITIDGFTYGIINPNIGDPIRFDIDNASIVSGEWDLYVERDGTFGTFGGSATHTKVYSISSDVYWSFLDIEDGELDITRKASVTFSDGSHTDFTTLIFEGSSMGLLSGGTLTTVSGTTVQADGGFGYVEKSDNGGIVRRIDWFNNQITLSANTDSYIFINENGNLGSSGSRPNSFYNIILGRVVTNNTGVSFIDLTPFNAEHTSNRYGNLFSEALGPIYANGSIVTQGTTPFTLNVSEGEYYYSTNEITPTGGTGITFNQYYRNGTGSTWVTSATTLVNNSQFDNNGTLTGLTAGYYTKHTLYLVGEGTYENYFLVLGQNQYSTLVATEDALLPTPPTYFTDSVVQVANIYIQQGTSGITQVEDIRPVIGFKAGGVNASSVHGNLLGLAADDHTQYLLVNGGRAMSGDLSLGGNSLTNILTANGVTIESHATRHQFGGADPVGSTTPSANAIPYADVSGTLDSWVSTATTTTLGKVKLSTNPVSSSNPIVIGDNDIRVARSLTGGTYSNGTATFTNNTGGTITLTGFYTGATDVRVTGGTYGNGTATFTNNTGGTFTVTGFLSNAVTATTLLSNVLSVTSSGGTPTNTTINAATGGTYSNGTITLSGTGTLSTITGLFTSSNDIRVTGGTYSNNTFTYINNTGGTFNVLFNTVTGLTVNGNITVTGTTSSGTISATTYQNLPTDVRITGGTYGNGTATFTNNTGGTFNVTGFLSNATTAVTLSSNVLSVTSSGGTPTTTTINAATGGTYSNGTITLAGTGTLSTITGLFTGATEVFVTGATYSNNTFTYTNNTGGTFSVLFNTVTGLTTNGNLTVTGTTSTGTISATTYQNLPTDVRVTGGTYGGGTATFTNNTGGTFNVTGFLSNATTAVTLSSNVLSVTSSGGSATNTTINAATGGTYSNGTITLAGTGTLSTITGLFTSANDIRVTGGTYSNGTATFTNNTGGTFNVTGFYTSANDTFVTGVTYSANTLTIKRNQSQPDLTTTVGLVTKSNTVTAGSFAGTPKKYTVTFTTPYSTTNYSISVTGSDNRSFTYETKTVNGFVINTNANTALTGNVDWMTISIGES